MYKDYIFINKNFQSSVNLELDLNSEKKIEEYIRNQLQEDIASDQISIKEYVDPFEKEQKEKERKIKKGLGPLKW